MIPNSQKLDILIAIGGGFEGLKALELLTQFNLEYIKHISLLYVRSLEKGMTGDGLSMRLARENLINWGMELPGLKYLQHGRDILIKLKMIPKDFSDHWKFKNLSGDPMGEYTIEYLGKSGIKCSLNLRASRDKSNAIVDECVRREHNLLVIGYSKKRKKSILNYFRAPSIPHILAATSPCSIIIAKNMNTDSGHLYCLKAMANNDKLLNNAVKFSLLCKQSITLLCVCKDSDKEEAAKKTLEESIAILHGYGIADIKGVVVCGKPVPVILDLACGHSLVVMGLADHPWVPDIMQPGIVHNVLKDSPCSVMLV